VAVDLTFKEATSPIHEARKFIKSSLCGEKVIIAKSQMPSGQIQFVQQMYCEQLTCQQHMTCIPLFLSIQGKV